MKLLIYPAVESERLGKIVEAARPMSVVNADGEEAALREIADADAFFGKLTPPLLAAAGRLRWVQSPTASLEHYMFQALVDHPCRLTNMRGIYADVIADHVFGYILCFARNFPLYLRQQLRSHWEAAGGEAERSGFVLGPSRISGMDRAHRHLPDSTLGIVGLGSIGSEIARRGLAFGMRVLAVDPQQQRAPDGVEALWRPDRLPDMLSASDFVVVAAPHTPETEKLFRRPLFQQMKPGSLLHQHRPWDDRGPGRSDRGAAGGRDRGGRTGCLRDRAPSPGPSALEDGQRDPHAARGRGYPQNRRTPPGSSTGQRAPFRRGQIPAQPGGQGQVVLGSGRHGTLEKL